MQLKKPSFDGSGLSTRSELAEVGLYVVNSSVYQVRPSKRDPNRRYALYIGDLYTGEVAGDVVRGLVYELQPNQRMTKEQAKAFGDVFGRCAWCGRELSTPESIKLGIGPVCKRYIQDYL